MQITAAITENPMSVNIFVNVCHICKGCHLDPGLQGQDVWKRYLQIFSMLNYANLDRHYQKSDFGQYFWNRLCYFVKDLI